jgi:uncharacterized membrane protein
MKRLIEDPRVLLAVLMISLAVNVFFVTLFAMQFSTGQTRHRWLDLQALEDRLVSRLPDPDAGIVRRVLQARQSEISAKMTALRQAREKARQALQAEPFVPPALTSAFTETRSAMQSLQEAVQSAIVQAATDMSAAGRRQIHQDREDRR